MGRFARKAEVVGIGFVTAYATVVAVGLLAMLFVDGARFRPGLAVLIWGAGLVVGAIVARGVKRRHVRTERLADGLCPA